MISAMENILQSYFYRSTLEEVDVRDVEQLASQYPYMAQVQYLLSKKYRDTGHPGYKKQVAKTALFFNNPHWLQHLLNDQVFVKSNFDDNIVLPEVAQYVESGLDKPVTSILPVEPAIEEAKGNPDFFGTEASIQPDLPVIEERVDIAEETIIVPAEQVAVGEQKEEIPALHNAFEKEDTAVAETETVPAEIDLAAPEEIALDTPPPAENLQEPNAETGVSTVEQQESEASFPGEEERTEKDPEPLPKLPFEKTTGAFLSIPADGGVIPIEPLHTIDYFASQGIKLREIEGKDKLSVKLKSFTEWLKTMKRLHPEKLEKESDEQVQSNIQHIAEHSNEVNEVVTEAMAEVFARQGLNQKAIEVYQKLSLLNPDKRAYFAAKISKLNDN